MTAIARAIILAMSTLSLSATAAEAQLGGLLFGNTLDKTPLGVAGGTYEKNNQIRSFIRARPYDTTDLYGKAITKTAEMTRDKGFTTFGVTKYKCTTTLMNNRPIGQDCSITAVMLQDGEETKPRGKQKVHYYIVSEVLAGKIARPVE